MKGKGARFMKNIISMVSCVTKAKCGAIRSKTDAMKVRLTLASFSLFSTRKKFSIASISGKIHDTIDGIFTRECSDNEEEISSKAIVLYNSKEGGAATTGHDYHYRKNEMVQGDENNNDDDDKYPDLRHSLFDEEDEKELQELMTDDPNSSVIDLVKNSKDQNGENFNLEDEIDQVADLFINKVRRRMRMQKLLSFKRHQQMMDRSV